MAGRGTRLRKAVERLEGKGTGRRYPPDLKAEILTYALASVAAGTSTGAISRDVGLSDYTLRRWLADAYDPAGASQFASVELVDPIEATPSSHSGIVIHAQGGLRIEGLDVDGLVQVLRSIR